MKKRRKKIGLGYPPGQECGLSYAKFKSGWLYKDAYEQVAWGRGEGPRTITKRVVLRHMSKLKKDEFLRYKKDCKGGYPPERAVRREGEYAEEGDTSFDFKGLKGLGDQQKFPFMQKEKFAKRYARTPWSTIAKNKTCSVHGRVKLCEDDDEVVLEYHATGHQGAVARMYIGEKRGTDWAVVEGVFVDDKLLGKGVGTKLYTAAAAWAAKHGLALASDTTRSVFSEAFWRKQAKKNRAKCLTPYGGGYYHSPLYSIQSKCDRGALPKADCDKILKAQWPKPTGGVWPCGRWQLHHGVSELGKIK